MEANIETAVRIHPAGFNNSERVCLQSNTINNTIQLGNQIYPVNYALPADCCQNTVFVTTVAPLVNYFLEGCDVSVVTLGQSGCGKSYTLLGPGFHFASSEAEHGIIPRFIREVFTKIKQYRDRQSSIHIVWSQICGENVQDLLGDGSVECGNISDVFKLIQLGMSNIAPKSAHTLFTLTLEQQWMVDATVQHRISTASFADLAGSEKVMVCDSNGMMQTIPTDLGIQALQRCILSLSEYNNYSFIPYSQSVLTTLLKDSFGGRAKTLLMCCVSPLMQDFTETLYTLQLALRTGMIKNVVSVNSYTTFDSLQDNFDIFGLQFAANQLFKLVSNAEELFQKLVSNGSLPKNDQEQVSQWLMLKQECEDCLSENSEPHRSLERIEEEIEDSYDSSESEAVEDENKESLLDKVQGLMENFRLNTDNLVSKSSASHITVDSLAKESISSSNTEYHKKGARGRRGSIHSAEEFHPSISLNTLSEKLHDSESLKNISEDGDVKLLELESLRNSKKHLEKIKKYKQKEEKRKGIYEKQMKGEKSKVVDGSGESFDRKTVSSDSKVVALISKSNETMASELSLNDEDLERLRHEVRKLRKTRHYLLEQRCKIDVKSQNKKILNEIEERKLLQYEEAIEAIDLAIEYKNQIMCGHQPLNVKALEEQGERMLMERLLKLDENEMRILLHKYFEKVVDLRFSSKKLEVQFVDVENQNENLTYRLHNLNQTLQRVRLDAERRYVSLQQQHEDKLHLVLRHLSNDGGDSDKVVARRVTERSNHCALTLKMPGGSKQVDKSSLITRFTRYARQETVPRQLQSATPAVPQAKVTRQKNKIFVQQTNK